MPGALTGWWLRKIRALFAVAARPEIVSLAGGSPFVSALPLDAVGDMVGRLIASHGRDVLQYLATAIIGCFGYGECALVERLVQGTEAR